MDYRSFTVEDFVLNESFQTYVLCTDAEAVAFWTGWRVRFPEKEPEINRAVELVRLLSGPKKAPIQPDRHAELHRLLDQLQPSKAAHLPSRSFWRYWAAAGVLALIALAAYYSLRLQPVRYNTTYGVTQVLKLPDGSSVTLNANSRIQHARHWTDDAPREVWLDGEAFFRVTKQKSGGKPVRFVVHTGSMDIEALGTEFNVSKREFRTQVVLEEGKVRLRVHLSGEKPIDMRPGETVEFTEADQGLTRKQVNPEVYTSWRTHQLVFQNTPLSEVAERIEQTYGVKVVFDDVRQRNRPLSGTAPSGDITKLSRALSRSFGLAIGLHSDTLRIGGGLPRDSLSN